MRVLVIGLGSIGLRHARNLLDEGYDVYGFDKEAKALAVFEHYGGKTVRAPFKEAFDVVFVCTPTMRHIDDMTRVVTLRSHIFVEKPIVGSTMQLDGLRRVLAYAKRNNRVVFVGNNLRFHPSVKTAKMYLRQGIIGKSLWASFICAQYSAKKPYLGDGVTLNWGAHEMDLALYLLGPAQVRASSINEDDSIADILVTHENGCMSQFHLDYHTKREQRRFLISGTKGIMIGDLPGRTLLVYDEKGLLHNGDYGGSYDQDYQEEIKSFFERIAGKESPGATGLEGYAAAEILLTARRSQRNPKPNNLSELGYD